MKYVKLTFVIFSVVISLLIYLHLKKFFDIDKCLDRGGKWDYQQHLCKFE